MENRDKEYILNQLHKHLCNAKKYYKADQILGVFLYGSQNYNADTEDSDVDSKMILVPTIEDLCFKRPTSTCFKTHFDDDGHCEIKDIREIANMFKKQNINFLEILYTDYFILNPKYEEVWNKNFIKIRDDIVRMDIRAAIKSIIGQIRNTLDRYPENNKRISNALRFTHFLRYYLAGWNYKDCIDIKNYEPEVTELIMCLKRDLIKDQANKDEIIKNILKDTEKLADRLDDYPFVPDKATAAAIDKATMNVITNNSFDFDFYNYKNKEIKFK